MPTIATLMPCLRLLLLGGLAGLPTIVAAMPVRDFLPRAERLVAKGPAAMFSSDLKPVMAEMKRVGAAYRADIERDRAAGRPARSCPPVKGKGRMNPNDMLAFLRAIPPAARGIDMTEAFHRYMAARHPC